jgi:hypothetical protein
MSDLEQHVDLSRWALDDALDELDQKGLVFIRRLINGEGVGARAGLFAYYDHFWRPWNPSNDAIQVAQCLMEVGEHNGINVPETANRLGWQPRRMNPALEYLAMRDAGKFGGEAAYPWRDFFVLCTAATRRFLRDIGEHG